MGAIQTKLENGLANLLIGRSPTWYAGDSASTFPEAPENSLLLLAHIALQMPPDSKEASNFYKDGLGGKLLPADQEADLHVGMGPSQIHFVASQDGPDADNLAQSWPGHLYCWVKDSRATLTACKSLQASISPSCSIVEEVHKDSRDGTPSAMVLYDPAGLNCFLINPAPRGDIADTIRAIDNSDSNALGILEAIHLIAPGTGQGVARFYKHFLGAAVSKEDKGQHKLLFSLGPSLQQGLTFLEDETVPALQQDQIGSTPVPLVCMYMPSMEMFERAFTRCADAGILHSGPGTWEEASKACEFRFRNCVDPDTKHVVLEMVHVVRVVEHPNCPLPAGQVWRSGQDSSDGNNKSDPPLAEGTKLTLAEVAKHNTKKDAWIVLNGQVLDVTRWIDVHPGGQRILIKNLGTDVSNQWNMIHATGTLERKLKHPRGPRVLGPLADAEQADPMPADNVMGA